MKVAASIISVLSLATTVVAQPSLSEFLADPDYSTFLSILELTGVDQTLFGGGPSTVFVPPNSGFEQLQSFSPGTLELLMSETPPEMLMQVVMYHVADGVLESSNITADMQIMMSNGESTNLTVGPPVMINGFPITMADIAVQEGVVHEIVAPLIPPSFSLLPGIAFLANSSGIFTVLTDLIDSAGLGGQLNSPGPFTVFAPTDDAFAKVTNLTDLAVVEVLMNHVVMGYITEEMLTDGASFVTLGQSSLAVSIVDGSVFINGNSMVVPPSMEGSNGVIHAIDTVIFDAPAAPEGGMPSAAPNSMPTMDGPSNDGGEEPTADSSGASAQGIMMLAASMLFAMLV